MNTFALNGRFGQGVQGIVVSWIPRNGSERTCGCWWMVILTNYQTHQNKVGHVEIWVHLQLGHHSGDLHEGLWIHFGEVRMTNSPKFQEVESLSAKRESFSALRLRRASSARRHLVERNICHQGFFPATVGSLQVWWQTRVAELALCMWQTWDVRTAWQFMERPFLYCIPMVY